MLAVNIGEVYYSGNMLNIKGHANKNYDRDLKDLYQSITEMGLLVIKLTELAKKALHEQGKDYRPEAKTKDKEINALDLKVEQQATSIMTKYQPFMDELRFLTSVIKIATSLERMGDMAKNTVKRAAKIASPIPAKTLEELDKMIDAIIKMIEDVLDVFSNFDPEKAKEIWKNDDVIDALYKGLFVALQNDMMKNPKNIPNFTHIIFASKNLERIADHATSLARMIYYINSGEKMPKD